jgi:hypothetical protein
MPGSDGARAPSKVRSVNVDTPTMKNLQRFNFEGATTIAPPLYNAGVYSAGPLRDNAINQPDLN